MLGVACGSLGALSAVAADELDGALDRFRAGDWTSRALPALEMASEAGEDWAVNDFVLVRRGAGQIAADVAVDGELYVRLAGDGVIVATPLGLQRLLDGGRRARSWRPARRRSCARRWRMHGG